MISNLIYGILSILIGIVCLIVYKRGKKSYEDNYGLKFRGFVAGIIGIILGVIFLKDWIFSFFR